MIQKKPLNSIHLDELEEIELEINSLDYRITNCLKNLKPKKQNKKFRNYTCYE